MRPLRIFVRVVHRTSKAAPRTPPPPEPAVQPRKTIPWFGIALAVSEALPFLDNEYNGILHALKAVRTELDKK